MEKRKTGIKVIDVFLTVCVILMAAVVVLFLLLPFILLAIFGLYVAEQEAFDAAPDQIMFINESSAAVCSVTVNDIAISDSILELGDDVTVEWEDWPATLTIYGESGSLGQLELPEAPDQDTTKDCWYIIAQDGPEGLILGLSQAENIEQRKERMGKMVSLDLSDGTVELYYAPGRGINGDGIDFMTLLFTEEEAAELEAQMEDALGWHAYTGGGLIDDIFYGSHTLYNGHTFCRDFDVPHFENGWYFFRDTYNANHGANDENQWEVERVSLPYNYTAALYDSKTNTLYIYDSDS